MVMHTQTHPGFLVKETLIDQTGLTVTQAAVMLGVSRTALSRLLNGHAGISPEMAMRLSKFFKNSVEMWINLQANYDVYLVKKIQSKIMVTPFSEAA